MRDEEVLKFEATTKGVLTLEEILEIEKEFDSKLKYYRENPVSTEEYTKTVEEYCINVMRFRMGLESI